MGYGQESYVAIDVSTAAVLCGLNRKVERIAELVGYELAGCRQSHAAGARP